MDVSVFVRMREDGLGPDEVVRRAIVMGHGHIECVFIVRKVFELSLREAKEALVVGTGAASTLEEHEARVAADLALYLEEDE
jgi:hypothetical protein